jgi:tRNA pseudouridine38-40 synthase
MNRVMEGKNVLRALNHFLRDFFIQKNKNLNKLASTKFVDYYNINCIAVSNCEVVEETFHARFSSKTRHYKYIILNQPEVSALDFNRVWHVRRELDLGRMVEASKKLLGKHDFTSFRSTECQAMSPIKTLDNCEIKRDGNKIIFNLSARSFLHHMVRNIVGTLKDVGLGKIDAEAIPGIIEAKDRRSCGVMAPSCGLYFAGVDY